MQGKREDREVDRAWLGACIYVWDDRKVAASRFEMENEMRWTRKRQKGAAGPAGGEEIEGDGKERIEQHVQRKARFSVNRPRGCRGRAGGAASKGAVKH